MPLSFPEYWCLCVLIRRLARERDERAAKLAALRGFLDDETRHAARVGGLLQE